MAIVPLFDAWTWIRSHMRGSSKLDASAQGAYSSFSVIYSLFESTACNGTASLGAMSKAALNANAARPTRAVASRVNDFVAYWAERFGSNTGMLFSEDEISDAHVMLPVIRLGFESRGAKLSDKALALMLCARFVKLHALANPKSIAALNEQVENLDIAAQSLALVLGLVCPRLCRR